MSTLVFPSQAIRDAEVPLLEAGVPLMARAASALARLSADVLHERRGQVAGSHVTVLAGPGNNAGDALFAAAALARRGARVSIIALFDRTHEEGRAAAVRAGADVITLPAEANGTTSTAAPAASAARAESPAADALVALTRADLVLDGIIGTGGRRGLPAHITALLDEWQTGEPTAFVLAVDIPSDLDVDADTPESRIRADATLTFGGLKTELVDPRAAAFTGAVLLADIGLDLDPHEADAELLTAADLEAGFPRPDTGSHKYSRGVLGVVAGSIAYPGAGVLTTGAAVNAAAGMVRYFGVGDVGERVLDRHAEVVFAPGRIDALVVGSGDPETVPVETGLAALADTPAPLLLDAGGLEMVGHAEAGHPGSPLTGRPVLLTPHAGELARLLSRLLGEIITARRVAEDTLHWARRAAETTGHIVLLKGAQTVIACPDGFALLPEPGPASLAAAGSGDVLTGIIGTLLAAGQAQRRSRGEDEPMPDRAAAHWAGLGVLLHNAAGRDSINAEQLVTAVGQVSCALIHGPRAVDGILVQ